MDGQPVLGKITNKKRLNKLRFSDKDKVNCQWMIFCIAHNIENLWRYGDTQYSERVT